MEENMNDPMRTFQGCVNQNSIKWLARGILKRGGDEIKGWLFEAFEKGLGGGGIFFLVCEEFERGLWKFWRAMNEKWWGVRFVDLCPEAKYKDNPLCNVLKKAEYLS
jgi:hypothetical protein